MKLWQRIYVLLASLLALAGVFVSLKIGGSTIESERIAALQYLAAVFDAVENFLCLLAIVSYIETKDFDARLMFFEAVCAGIKFALIGAGLGYLIVVKLALSLRPSMKNKKE